jgi:D-threo-aldose 1-dehydrogenase
VSFPLRRLGHTGLSVTELGFGTAPLGNLFRPLPDALARESLAAAEKAGFGYYDTAPFYGFGLSERRLGDALRARKDIVLST